MNSEMPSPYMFERMAVTDTSIFEIYFLSYRLALQTDDVFVGAANDQHFSVADAAKQRNIYA